MKKPFGVILILMIFTNTVNAQENKAANICNKEIKKKQPQLKRVQEYCNTAGNYYQKIGTYPKALKYYQITLAMKEKILGKGHASTATSYNDIGFVYHEMRNYPKALKYYKTALSIDEKVLKKEHASTSSYYNNIGTVYNDMGDYPKALKYYKTALSINEKVLGREHASTGNSYNNIGFVYHDMGDYPKALKYYKIALSINEKVLGKEHASTAPYYNNIGSVYHDMGDYPKALKYYKIALSIDEKILGKEHFSTTSYYNNIGTVYHDMGDYPKALKYYKIALKVKEKVLGKEHASTSSYYNNIGTVYHDMGDYPKALKYYKIALSIDEKVLGKEHISTSSYYNNIGTVYNDLGDYPKALEYYKIALSINEKVRGKEHTSTANSYNNIGSVSNDMGDYPKALKYYKIALSISKKILGKEHVSTASYYNNIGSVYHDMRDYPKALKYYKMALRVRENVLGKKHADTANSYNNMSYIYMDMGDYPKSYYYTKQAFNIFLSNREQVFTILDSQQKEKYLKSTKGYITSLIVNTHTYINKLKKDGNIKKSQQILSSGANAWLNYKGSIFDSENAIAMLYSNTKDQKLKAKIDDLVRSKRHLAKLYQSLPSPKEKASWKNDIKSTEEKIANLTNNISSKASSFKKQQKLKSITYKDITSHLKKDELYIDYAKVGNHYYIFSLDTKEHIKFIQINRKRTNQIDNLVKTFREDIMTILKDTKITDENLTYLTQRSKEKLSELYELTIGKPLADIIKSKTSLIISPDGALRLLPFEALFNKEKEKYIIEAKEIRYIPSGKELVRLYKYSKDKKPKVIKSAVIFANPNFDTQIASISKEQIAITPNTSRSGIIKSLFRMRFSPLPGTKAEAKAIKATLAQKSIFEYQREKANESNLMKIQEPKILHIATHGFFINDNTIPNPMLKSGIALTGANASAIKGKSDGIVTALKLSGLNLKGTDLVVLSACQTGVVDINSTDSVSGLSKAFIQAGAKDIVMSLWSVDDEATKELMTSFYQEMKKKDNYAKALKAAKLKMIAEGRHPFYWAAFVVSGL